MEKEYLEKNESQQTEGILPDYASMGPKELEKYLKERLPAGVLPEDVEVLKVAGEKGEWHWRLRPEKIKDEKIRRQYEEEQRAWPDLGAEVGD